MWWIPYEKLVFKTHLSKEQVGQKLAAVIETETGIFLSPRARQEAKPYAGKLSANGFGISKASPKNSGAFLPKINGAIESDSQGCSLVITMRPSLLMLFAMAFGLFFLASLAINVLTGADDGKWGPNDFVSLALWIGICYLFPIFSFNRETGSSTEFFLELLDAYDGLECGFFQRNNSS